MHSKCRSWNSGLLPEPCCPFPSSLPFIHLQDHAQFNGNRRRYRRMHPHHNGSLALFGVPPEQYWEYDINKFDDEPPAFCYSFASNFQALKYFRVDEEKKTPREILSGAKNALAQKLPLMFWFHCLRIHPERGKWKNSLPKAERENTWRTCRLRGRL